MLPLSIRVELVTEYLYSDIFQFFSRYFSENTIHNGKLLFDLAFGFQPRIFEPSGKIDDEMLIYDED